MFEGTRYEAPPEPAAPVRWSERSPDAALGAVLERPPDPDVGAFERLERLGGFDG